MNDIPIFTDVRSGFGIQGRKQYVDIGDVGWIFCKIKNTTSMHPGAMPTVREAAKTSNLLISHDMTSFYFSVVSDPTTLSKLKPEKCYVLNVSVIKHDEGFVHAFPAFEINAGQVIYNVSDKIIM